MGSHSRRKGAQYEREVARRYSAIRGVDCKRNLVETREGNDGDTVSNIPVSDQCRCGKNPSPWRAIQDAEAGASEGEHPVAWVYRNRKGTRGPEELVVMRPADWLEIVEQLVATGAW